METETPLRCASEHTTVQYDKSLANTRCTNDPGHRGMCRDAHGRSWMRASEYARVQQEMAAQAQEWARVAADAQRAERLERMAAECAEL